MAYTNKGSKWEMKNSLFLIWAFIPILNCIPFFHMNSRVKNKKWAMLGWASIILYLIFILLSVTSLLLSNPYERPSYYDIEKAPEIVDFMTDEQKKKYYDDSSYVSSSDFMITDEYEKYENAYEAWQKKMEKWEKQPEIAAQIEKWDNFYSNKEMASMSSCVAIFVIYVIFLIIALTDRVKYLKLLEQSENKSSVTNRFNTVEKNVADKTENAARTENTIAAVPQIDINSATEEELSALQGLTIIDVKKAVAYREEHNGFDNVDEFFASVNAKPHIIVALEKQLVAGDYKNAIVKKTDNSGKRMIDL